MEIYDVGTNTWSAGPVYPLLISFVSAWTDGTFIYAAGGIASVGSLASNKTYRLDPANLGAGWNDAAIADLPDTRWGAAAANYQGDLLMCGGYVAGSVTANISTSAISFDREQYLGFIPNMAGHLRARRNAPALPAQSWAPPSNAVGGRSVASSGFVGTNGTRFRS